MTTTVIVKTCSWPVQVRSFPLENRQPVEGANWSAAERVEPDSERTFYVHDGIDLLVQELPLEPGHNALPPIDE